MFDALTERAFCAAYLIITGAPDEDSGARGINGSTAVAGVNESGAGSMFVRFANVGYEVGVGYPVMDPAPTPDGLAMYTWTQKPNGELTGIYWNPELGDPGYESFHYTSFTVKPPVVNSWSAHGWETGKGYPATQLITNNTVGNGCWLTNNTGCTPASYGQVQLFEKYDSAGNLIGKNCACIDYGGGVNWVTIY